MNRFEKVARIGLAGLTIAIGVLTIDTCNDYQRDEPETYSGFQEELAEGLEPVSVNIRTRGDVVFVRKLPDAEYDRNELPDGRVQLEGVFEYQIRKPKYDNPDADPRLYLDIREGIVVLDSIPEPQLYK